MDSLTTVTDTLVLNPAIGAEVFNILVLLVGTVTSIILGVLKKFVFSVDSVALNLIKPFQPLIVTVVPIIAQMLGIQLASGDTALFIAAPASAIIIVTLREIGKKIKTALDQA